MDPFERGLVHSEVFTFSDVHHVHNHLLFEDAVDDSHRFLRRIEFVITCEVESGLIAYILAEGICSSSGRVAVSPCILCTTEADAAGLVGRVAIVTV